MRVREPKLVLKGLLVCIWPCGGSHGQARQPTTSEKLVGKGS